MNPPRPEFERAPTLSRRGMLRQTAMGMGLLGFASLAAKASAGAGRAAPHFAPRAKRVVFLFMNGGPSHVDTVDPKPALEKHRGQAPSGKLYKPNKGDGFMPSPFAFKPRGQSGIEMSESLPELATLADELCVVRSMRTDIPNHEPALIQMHTGAIQPVRPSMGSWLLYGLGSLNENLPGYVALRPSSNIVVGPALWSNGFLPAQHQGADVITKSADVDQLIANIRNPSWTPQEQRRQLDLLTALNRSHIEGRERALALEGEIQNMETAYRMQAAAADAFDIAREPAEAKERYGDTPFGRSCLLARRLIENEVRFVTVYYVAKGSNQPWDTHKDHNNRHAKLCRDSDRASAALIRDLKSRGLLDDTLVVWGGEFGRTPYSEQRDAGNAGRDHHHTAFSMIMAGGGLKKGHVYGETDELGMRVVKDPMHVHDFHATLLHLMGIDHERLTYRYSGRDFRLTDVFGNVAADIIA